jgi:hypothetical protein
MSQYKDKLDKFNPRDNYIEGLLSKLEGTRTSSSFIVSLILHVTIKEAMWVFQQFVCKQDL